MRQARVDGQASWPLLRVSACRRCRGRLVDERGYVAGETRRELASIEAIGNRTRTGLQHLRHPTSHRTNATSCTSLGDGLIGTLSSTPIPASTNWSKGQGGSATVSRLRGLAADARRRSNEPGLFDLHWRDMATLRLKRTARTSATPPRKSPRPRPTPSRAWHRCSGASA